MHECNAKNFDQQSCTIENLESLTDYNVQVWQHCTNDELNSYPASTSTPVGTRPIPAVAPSALFCTQMEPLRFYADWWASASEDCEFVSWELDAQLLPRTAGFTADGLYEEAAPGGDWVTKCTLYDRTGLDCWVEDLLANREYKIRVRETCTNPLANSPFFQRYQECTTLTMPAFEPFDLAAYNMGLYTFEVSWLPNDPKACIFQYWDVQVKVNGTAWPEGDDPPVFGCRLLDRGTTNCTVHVGLNSGESFEWRIREACTVRRLFSNWVYYPGVAGTRLPVPASQPANLTAISNSPSHDVAYTSLDVSWDALPPGECIFTGWKVETSILGQAIWQESAECRANSREPFECIITTGLFSNVYYDMQISETCVDPNAEGPTLTISNIARTRPVPAVAPVLVSVSATSARSLGVNFIAPSMGQCVFKAYKMEWMMQGWDYWLPYDDCTRTSLCSVGNFPASQSYYTVRMMVSCEDPLADSPWVEWPDFVQTWPEPAQAPTNFTLVELTAYNVTFTFEPGLGLDCTWASWKVQILQGISDPPGSSICILNLARRWAKTCDFRVPVVRSPSSRAMAIAPSSAVTLAGADQAVRAAISAAQKSGWKVAVAVCDAGGNLIALQRMDGCMPIGAEIATEKARSAILFARETKLLEGAVNAEKSNGAGRAALLTSGRVLMEGGVPIVDPAHGRIIGACGVSGVKPDEDAQVAKAAVENLTSEHWTDLTECENEMQFRENLTCTVTSLLSNTPYQVRVRETCTNYIYDSGWGYSPQFYSSMPVQAGLPQAFAVVENSVTAFFFDVTWVAGPAGQCVFKEWVMEVYQSSPEMGDWALPPLVQLLDDSQTWVEHKCLASRAAPLCRPGDLPRSLKQNSTYAVRVKESCTDPNADGDFVMLDFNVTTSIALEPAEAPDNLTISNETAYTFLLEFDAGAPHDCYFTGWHVEIRENWTEGNYSNETNFTELNYSLWVPREECKEEDIFPRDRMRCIVPRLRKHSLYDAKVRETCYEGYTEALDSGFSPDLPDRQARATGGGSAEITQLCWGHGLSPEHCCRDPPLGNPSCWGDVGLFDLCCTRWLHPRPLPAPADAQELRHALGACMGHPAPMTRDDPCGESAYAAAAGAPVGRLLWCSIQVAPVSKVLDVFLGSGCSGATAAAALADSKRPSAVVGFEDVDAGRAAAARRALGAWRPRRVRDLRAVSARIRSGGLKDSPAVWLLNGGVRPNSTECQQCASSWKVDCPERCAYQYGVVEAACEALHGVDLVFFDSDGSAADGWLAEWLAIERACAPGLVLLLNLSLPNHGAWIRDRLRALGYEEVWWEASLLHQDIYATMAFSDVRRVRSWALLAYTGGSGSS
ncbi:unnamed protein product [Effrenium voratum]|nr:unnamed protein product [Effrenium voratum]